MKIFVRMSDQTNIVARKSNYPETFFRTIFIFQDIVFCQFLNTPTFGGGGEGAPLKPLPALLELFTPDRPNMTHNDPG